MSTLRKYFTSAVMMVTVLSLSVVAAPASAASAGDLVKVDGASAVYYLGADMRLYVFPNEDVYFSWYNDFSSVVTISATELNSYGAPKANITMRPGSYLVKRPVPTAPEVYAVEPGGVLRWIDSEATAKTLYGDNWASRVVDVVDSFFTNYLADDAKTNKVTATSYPAGSLVKWEGAADVYYIAEDGKARKIANESAFVANRFDWNDVITAPASVAMPTAGSEISGYEAALAAPSSGATGVGATPGAGTGLSVALASDSPQSATVPSNATQVVMTKFNVTASSDGAITLKDVTVKRSGVGSTSDISKVYLYDGSTRLTTGKNLNSTTNEVTFNSVGVTVSAGATKTLSVVVDVANGATGNHALGIESASDITTNSGATVSGSFPVRGNTMSMSATSVGSLTVENNDHTTNTAKVGQEDVEIADFDIDNNNVEDVRISGITLTNGGNALPSNLGDIELVYNGSVIATGVLANNKIAFAFDPITLTKGASNENFKVRADIEGGINNTVKLYLAYATDITAVGVTYGYNVGATIDDFDSSSDSFELTIEGAEVTLNLATDNAETVIADQKDFKFATLEVTVAEEIEVTEMRVTVVETNGGDAGVIDIDELQLKNKKTGEYIDGTVVSGSNDDAAAEVVWKFENFSWNPGMEGWEIIGDIPSNASSTDSYHVKFDFSSDFTARYVASNNEVEVGDLSATTLTGKKKTIGGPALTVTPSSFNSGNAVAGTANVILAGGRMDANSVSAITVSEMVFKGGAATTTLDTDDNNTNSNQAFDKTNIASVRLKINGQTVATKSGGSLTDGEVTFNSFSSNERPLNVIVPKSGNVTFSVEADIAGTLDTVWKHINLQLSSITARDANNDTVTPKDTTDDTDISDSDRVAFQRLINLHDNGILAVAMENTVDPVDAQRYVLAGTSAKKLARIKMTAQYESVRIDKIVIANNDDEANDSVSAMHITDANGNVLASESVIDAGASSTATFENQSGLFTVNEGTTYYYITADLRNIGSTDPTATADSQDYFEVMVTDIEAQGTAGSDLTPSEITFSGTGAVDGNAGGTADRTGVSNRQTVVGTKITSIQNVTTGSLPAAEGTETELFRFTVTTSNEATNSSSTDATAGTLNAVLEELKVKVNYNSNTLTTTVAGASYLKLYRDGKSGFATAAVPASGSETAFDFSDPTDLNKVSSSWSADNVEIAPGTTATFYVRGFVYSDGENDSVSMNIDDLNGTSGDYDIKWHDGTGNMMYDLLLGKDQLEAKSVSN